MAGELKLWQRYQQHLYANEELGLAVDISRMNFDDAWLGSMESSMQRAYVAMDALEKGAIANPDENRMVGHYWLRNPKLAPMPEIRREIEGAGFDIKWPRIYAD